jgi:hypothetical protein
LKKVAFTATSPPRRSFAAEAFDYAWKSAFETRIHDLEQVPNSIEKLKRFT